MRVRAALALMLATALVVSVVPTAMASGIQIGKAKYSYKLSMPRTLSSKVKIGQTFEASGSVTPTFSPDSTNTIVKVRVQEFVHKKGRHTWRTTADETATITTTAAGKTAYTATLPGVVDLAAYRVDARVIKDGKLAGTSPARPIVSVYPFKVGQPRVKKPVAKAGTTFETSGSISPTIPVDSGIIVKIRISGPRGVKPTRDVTATLAPFAKGTSYTTSLSLPSAGKYSLVAIVLNEGGVTLGRSLPRSILVRKR